MSQYASQWTSYLQPSWKTTLKWIFSFAVFLSHVYRSSVKRMSLWRLCLRTWLGWGRLSKALEMLLWVQTLRLSPLCLRLNPSRRSSTTGNRERRRRMCVCSLTTLLLKYCDLRKGLVMGQFWMVAKQRCFSDVFFLTGFQDGLCSLRCPGWAAKGFVVLSIPIRWYGDWSRHGEKLHEFVKICAWYKTKQLNRLS